MSVDNNAILFVGLPEDELPIRDDFDDIEDYIDWLKDSFGIGEEVLLGYRSTNEGYHLIGFTVGDSGRYGIISIDNAESTIASFKSQFWAYFQLDPNVYLFNYQW